MAQGPGGAAIPEARGPMRPDRLKAGPGCIVSRFLTALKFKEVVCQCNKACI